MNVTLFMGTNLPDIHATWQTLLREPLANGDITLWTPEGLPVPDPTKFAKSCSYDSANPGWDFDSEGDPDRFIMVDPRRSPVPQLEAIAEAMQAARIEPLKVVTVVDCTAVEQSGQMRTYIEACIYYSDVILLGNRAQESKKYIHDYQRHFEKLCYPCLFFMLKADGRFPHPETILVPNVRRISQLFDLQEEPIPAPEGMIVEASCDLELDEPEIDPYRHLDPNASSSPIPDVSSYIVS